MKGTMTRPGSYARLGDASPRPVRRRHGWPWGFWTAATLCLGLLLSGAAYLISLPGVGNAQARVQAIVREHHGVLVREPPPGKLADAVVAVEDEYFYSNVLLNVLYGAARATFASLTQSGDPGGSTIEQQLAKQIYPHPRGPAGTLEEIGLGIKLSLFYSKEQILAMYLNAVYYGHGYWGAFAAARGYFGVAPRNLTWAEATLLAGLVQGPSLYDPLRHFELAKRRQAHVIEQLADNHYLSGAQAAAVYHAPLPLKRS